MRVPDVDARGVVWMRVLMLRGAGQVVVSEGDRETVLRAVPGEGLSVAGSAPRSSWRSRVAEGPIRVRSGGRGVAVRGVVEVHALYGPEASGGREGLAVINEVPLERYLAGTLGREMYESWGSVALQAQAVASRTYAVHQRQTRLEAPWHLSSGTLSQVYGGVEAESEAVEQALEDTRGQILVQEGEPILAVFHSSSGGQTASAEEVWGEPREYLQSITVDDEWDSPDAYWRARVTRGTLGRAAAELGSDLGSVTAATIVERTASGRVARLELVGDRGRATVTGRELRSVLGESILKSTLFELRTDEGAFVFVGSGNGHGVGMSQWGARAMARRGEGYREILETFYPGTRITRLGRSRR